MAKYPVVSLDHCVEYRNSVKIKDDYSLRVEKSVYSSYSTIFGLSKEDLLAIKEQIDKELIK